MCKKYYKVLLLLLVTGILVYSEASQWIHPAQAENVMKSDSFKTRNSLPDIEEIKEVQGRLILGQKEWVSFLDLEQSYRARVDTGAATSSLNAAEQKIFIHNGKKWVRFRVRDKDRLSEELSLPVKRWVRIKQVSNERGSRRPVIEARIRIGDRVAETEFTLADRSHLSFPILIGRSYIRNYALVDVSRSYIQGK
ncbi:ATP-dependent zinc protease family protein [Vibrio salinus]|uniref:ATP-dependent zinc protease family protein n=1 Tax=Vibrio salinus TaxID=2899784 RepID=UPI001E5F761B|nr:ATP-dependent zinc protease [Vibrio salinus]MCE0495395.1 ATP-dependent zinc protease [Vibrio salinus]